MSCDTVILKTQLEFPNTPARLTEAMGLREPALRHAAPPKAN